MDSFQCDVELIEIAKFNLIGVFYVYFESEGLLSKSNRLFSNSKPTFERISRVYRLKYMKDSHYMRPKILRLSKIFC